MAMAMAGIPRAPYGGFGKEDDYPHITIFVANMCPTLSTPDDFQTRLNRLRSDALSICE